MYDDWSWRCLESRSSDVREGSKGGRGDERGWGPAREGGGACRPRSGPVRGWRSTIGNLIDMFRLKQKPIAGLMLLYTREQLRGTVSSNPRVQTVLLRRPSANRSPWPRSRRSGACQCEERSTTRSAKISLLLPGAYRPAGGLLC